MLLLVVGIINPMLLIVVGNRVIEKSIPRTLFYLLDCVRVLDRGRRCLCGIACVVETDYVFSGVNCFPLLFLD
jgi:hypothetical protein